MKIEIQETLRGISAGVHRSIWLSKARLKMIVFNA